MTPVCIASHLQAEPSPEIFELLLELRERHRARLLLLLRARRAHEGKQLGPRRATHRAAYARRMRCIADCWSCGPASPPASSPALVAPRLRYAPPVPSEAEQGREAWRAVVGSSAGRGPWRAGGTSGTQIGKPSSPALILVGIGFVVVELVHDLIKFW